MTEVLPTLANAVMQRAKEARLTIVTAESCTAGFLCQTLSDTEGAGERFHGGFVTYTKAQKSVVLDVSPALLRQKGAVCTEVARAMAEGALRHSPADLAVAITGVAGPEPDEDGNPVGRVCIAVARRDSNTRDTERHYGAIGRDAIREAAATDALRLLVEAMSRAAAAA